MTQEQKAKAYNEALERARIWQKHLYDTNDRDYADELNYIFPELKESEDERIRKALINYFKYGVLTPEHPERELIESWIAWLEKQGDQKTIDSLTPQEAMDIAVAKCFNEQKSADKIEPKFKVGEWITHNTANFVFKIINVGSNGYEVVNRENYKKTISFDNEDNYHLWTIQDAKDGDVLVFKNNISGIIICKSPTDYDTGSYCRLVSDNLINKEESGWDSTLLVPAAKEQRDVLMKAMTDAGYTFDFDKKELEKIEQKPAWSEEDEKNLQGIIDEIQANKSSAPSYDINVYDRFLSWLKSLKERIGG